MIVRDDGGPDPEIRARHPATYAYLRVSGRDERHRLEEAHLEVGRPSKPEVTTRGLVELFVFIRERTIGFHQAASNRDDGPFQGSVWIHVLHVRGIPVRRPFDLGTQRTPTHADADRRRELVAHIGPDVVVVDPVCADHAVVASARDVRVGPGAPGDPEFGHAAVDVADGERSRRQGGAPERYGPAYVETSSGAVRRLHPKERLVRSKAHARGHTTGEERARTLTLLG